MLRLYCPGLLRPEMFPGIGALPEPATGSHVVFIGVTVAAAASSTELTLIMMAGPVPAICCRGGVVAVVVLRQGEIDFQIEVENVASNPKFRIFLSKVISDNGDPIYWINRR